MSDRQPICLHCEYAIRRGTARKGTVWVHVATGSEQCRPTHAAPVFPGDPTWHEPLDGVLPRIAVSIWEDSWHR